VQKKGSFANRETKKFLSPNCMARDDDRVLGFLYFVHHWQRTSKALTDRQRGRNGEEHAV
jgi:hypothetical protein